MNQENSTLIDQHECKSSEKAYSDFTSMTEEEKQKQQKNRKAQLIAGAIGDGVSAFANLFFTSKGVPMASSKGKDKQPSLYERIYGRHREEDNIYIKNKAEWNKTQEKVRKEQMAEEEKLQKAFQIEQQKQEKEEQKKKEEEEKPAKYNARMNIHADYQPYERNWDDKDWINLMYGKMLSYLRLGNKNKTLKFFEGFDTDGSVGLHVKREFMENLLGGKYTDSKELDDEFLNSLRSSMTKEDEYYRKIR